MVKVAIIRGNAYNATLRALELTKFRKIIKGRKKIIIKPNLVLPIHSTKGITTDVNVVRAILDFLPSSKKVIIADGSSEVEKTFKLNEYAKLAKEYGVQLMNLEKDEKIKVRINRPIVFREIDIAKTVLRSDFVISVAKLKIHSLTGITGSLKNMMGVCPKVQRLKLHAFLPYSLLDLFSIILPDFGIIDGIIGNEIDENIPHPVKVGVILASKDCVALDIVASEIMGINVEKVFHVCSMYRKRSWDKKNRQIEIVGEDIKNVKKIFKRKNFNLRSYTQKMIAHVLINLGIFDPLYSSIEKNLLVRKLLKSMFF